MKMMVTIIMMLMIRLVVVQHIGMMMTTVVNGFSHSHVHTTTTTSATTTTTTVHDDISNDPWRKRRRRPRILESFQHISKVITLQLRYSDNDNEDEGVSLSNDYSSSSNSRSHNHHHQLHNSNCNNNHLHQPIPHVDILWSYVYNLQRVRREYNSNHYQDKKKMLEPIISFLYFLQQQQHPSPSPTIITQSTNHVELQQQRELLIEPLQRALIQAIRISSTLNNYRYILQLVNGAIHYANATTMTTGATTPILNPRIMGEAITELYRCHANLNKIRSVWKLLMHEEHAQVWIRPVSAYELNSLLHVYIQECKVYAALDLYQTHCNTATDAHSLCFALQALHESVTKHMTTAISTSTTGSPLMTATATKDSHGTVASSERMPNTVHSSWTYAERYRTISASTIQIPELIPLLPTISSSSSSNQGWWQWNMAIALLDQALARSPEIVQRRYHDNYTTTNYNNNINTNVSMKSESSLSSSLWHNNLIWTMLLQLNEACGRGSDTDLQHRNEPSPQHQHQQQYQHDQSRMVQSIMHILQQRNIQPDTRTSALLLSSLQSHPEIAVSLLRSASMAATTIRHTNLSKERPEPKPWTLAPPNEYMYSAVMTICARQRQYPLAIQLLNEYESQSVPLEREQQEPLIPSKVYLYNSALQALTTITTSRYKRTGSKSRKRVRKQKKSKFDRTKERITLAFQLYHRMMINNSTGISSIPSRQWPDIVTYNTLLAVLVVDGPAEAYQESYWKYVCENLFLMDRIHYQKSNLVMMDAKYSSYLEHLIHALLDRMQQYQIDRDTVTYKQAIRALMSIPMTGDGNIEDGCMLAVLKMIRRAHMDLKRYQCRNIVLQELYNEALYLFAGVGNVIGIIHIMTMLVDDVGLLLHNVRYENVWLHLINGLGNGFMTSALPAVLSGNITPDTDLYVISNRLGLDWTKVSFPSFKANHFSAAISCCLKESDFESARHVLTQMRALGIRPTSETLHDISRSYAIIALEYKDPKSKATPSIEHPSVIRARSSYAILSSIDNPSNSLVALVSRACCSSGMFVEAQTLLRSLHQRVLQLRWEEYEANSFGISNPNSSILLNEICSILSPLHQDLLRYCAKQGNVTNALSLCEDIQYISKQLMIQTKSENEFDTLNVTEKIDQNVPISNMYGLAKPAVGITISGWKSILIAASKSGHWRVCLSTLQFLRPYLEATRPCNTISMPEQAHRNMLYSQLEPAIQTAIKCLAIRSQYGWIVRVIDDWIEWSGDRRPPPDAILSAIRTLATRGRGEEVNNLLTRCVNLPCTHSAYDDTMYRAMLFVGAITALYNEGLYDEADDAFVSAINRNSLPLNLRHETINGTERRISLDLHGMNQAVAHSAVRIALQQLAISADQWDRGENSVAPKFDTDMIIITGRGLNSALKMRPVLRPVVQRMLVEEFYPPLGTMSVPGNMGAIRISSSDIAQFLEHQRQQKGARLLLVAAMLKDIVAPGGRLRNALAQVKKGTE